MKLSNKKEVFPMKEQYVEPQMELIAFSACDIIATSTIEETLPDSKTGDAGGGFTLPEWGNGGDAADEWL